VNCKHVQELLPLYVGHDLEEKRAKLVTAHVRNCAECASSADEYRETRQLLQQFAPPPFSDAVYAGIRRRVLQEIGRESTAQARPQLVASLFRPRIRWAFATALLFAVCLFAFYFSTNRTNERQHVAINPPVVDPSKGDEQPTPQPRDDKPPSSGRESGGSTGALGDRNNGSHGAIAGSVNRVQQSQRRKSPGAAAVARSWSGSVNKAKTRAIVEASPKTNSAGDPDAGLDRDPGSSQKTLRMEIQTRDRNIRIIWFSQPTKKHSSSESYKGI
jgi:hypothetical protein